MERRRVRHSAAAAGAAARDRNAIDLCVVVLLIPQRRRLVGVHVPQVLCNVLIREWLQQRRLAMAPGQDTAAYKTGKASGKTPRASNAAGSSFVFSEDDFIFCCCLLDDTTILLLAGLADRAMVDLINGRQR